MRVARIVVVLLLSSLFPVSAQVPHPVKGGYALPNGWTITPVGRSIPTEDLLLNVSPAPDGRAVIALHGGFNPHGLVVIDTRKVEAIQRIPLKSAWLGLAWNPAGSRLYVSGGNANGVKPTVAPIYAFDYSGGKLGEKPSTEFRENVRPDQVYWSGLAHHPKRNVLYAANRTGANAPGYVAVFDTTSARCIRTIQVQVAPYDLVLSRDGSILYVSNWSSDSISVIDTAAERVVGTIEAGNNPNDMELSPDGRLFVACGNENSVLVVDTAKRLVIERISVSLFPRAPTGSTPNGLALDTAGKMLFVANADNNAVAVVNVAQPGRSEVLGFIPTGWYPSSLALQGGRLFIGNSKGLGSYSNVRGPRSPLPKEGEGSGSVKSLQKGSVNILPLGALRQKITGWTKQVFANTPYRDEFLSQALLAKGPTIVPSQVGAGSVIKHVIYIIKENRTYDQVFGDIPTGNGDARLAIFGREVTPNQHALAEQFVLFDNLYCDGEVSVDGHSWSNAAYATDFNEKFWPANYGGHSRGTSSAAFIPGGGNLWDLAAAKGLTYRSYGEYASRSSDGTTMEASPGVGNLFGHVAPRFKLPGMRDTDNVRAFLREFDEFEKSYDDPDRNKRLPNYIVMSLPENHTSGTRPGAFTPKAMVANNDYAVGMLVDRVTHSRYWPETAIFIIEDDAQDGPDHVDARRTIGLVISPYTKRRIVDSTLYTTSSMLRTMELLLGLPPMTQFDASATPMYNAFTDRADLTPYAHMKPLIDVNQKNLATAWGAKESTEMNLDEIDRAPMYEFNEIIWKSVMGPDSPMPAPLHRFRFQGGR